MNSHVSSQPGSRSIYGSVAILFAVLILAMSQFGGGAAQPAPVPDAGSIFTGYSFPGNNPGAMLFTPEGDFTGANGQGEFLAHLRESFSNVRFETQTTEVAGPLLIIEFSMSGIHTGAYHGANADCARISVPGVAVIHLADDGIAQQWITYDQQTILDQIHVYSLSPENERASCEMPGIELDDEDEGVVQRPACMLLNSCSYQP